jgi:undecaprenyl-diphosphatase
MISETVKVAVLALVQGVTEILPVSSSGHLVLGKALLHLESRGALMEAVLHGGTLLAILAYYRVRLVELCVDFLLNTGSARRDVAALILGIIPAGVAGVLFEDRIDAAFDSPRLVGFCLMITGFMLLLPRIFRPATLSGRVTIPQALKIGVAQIMALLPGVSRSGTTITAGRLVGVEGKESAQFSFLMAIPLIGGALGLTVLKAVKAGAPTDVSAGNLAMGFVVAAIAGYLAMTTLNKLLSSNKLWFFGPYCLVVGLLAVLFIR